ncbi:hypothetical protein [Luteimonas fraxinea]|uniref:hypothetical protein n=1 Tax=Luteimonas fraxinea TaxID=2901869 RepID=UPI001E36955C|nr:hypothetical protein [Luteimonas fraxinea]MCD9126554.1 hypothetical protein [Luteimonas fraxinea]
MLKQVQSFRAVARLTFVLAKVSKTIFAGRDPPRYSRGDPLRFSDDGARSPHSLRSDMGSSPTPPSCDARLALLLDSRARATATATATATAARAGRNEPQPQQSKRAAMSMDARLRGHDEIGFSWMRVCVTARFYGNSTVRDRNTPPLKCEVFARLLTTLRDGVPLCFSFFASAWLGLARRYRLSLFFGFGFCFCFGFGFQRLT